MQSDARKAADSRRHAWLIGASSGIGAALALELVRRGWQVTLSARRRESLARLADDARAIVAASGNESDAVDLEPMDVTDSTAIGAVWSRVSGSRNPVTHVIYLAGDYTPMPIDAFDPTLFRRTMEINYFGAITVLNAVLPTLRQRGHGDIVLTASVAGYRGLPRAAPYNASKAALISLAESLQPELAAEGVGIRLINPGFVRTALTDKNPFEMPFLMEPEAAARRIADGLDGRGFEIAFPRRLVCLLKLLRCLPYAVYFKLMRRLL